MKKTIKIGDCYNIYKKYGDLNLNVNTPYGYKKIEDCDITAKNSKYVTIETENNKKLVCSPKHEIKVSNGKFVHTENLVVGKSRIITNKGTSKLKSFELSRDRKDLYDIQVENVKQYYSNGIVSHNSTIMKLVSYILFKKTLETETQMKAGDQRYVNNRNDATSCEGGVIISVNGEYYGIKRITTLELDKKGEIKASPTTLAYHVLETPEDTLKDENSLDSLNEKDRYQTQLKIEKAIGSYENFNKVVLTTSDTLNRILSNDKAEFIDSILHDSGLDIFDKKLTAFKSYEKDILGKPRVSCNIAQTEDKINDTNIACVKLNNEVDELERNVIPTEEDGIEKGKDYVETLIKKLYKIDDEIYNLDVDNTNKLINIQNNLKTDYKERLVKLNKGMSELKETYDKERLEELITKKENSIRKINEIKMSIKDDEHKIINVRGDISLLNGQMLQLKNDGKTNLNLIKEYKESKTCPACGQLKTPEHQEHINDKIKEIEDKMFNELAPLIKAKQLRIPELEYIITDLEKGISKLKTDIDNLNHDSIAIIEEIGLLNIDKQDVERRRELKIEADSTPLQLENIDLKVEGYQQKLLLHENMEKQIEENRKIESGIIKAKNRIIEIERSLKMHTDMIYNKKTLIAECVTNIRNYNDLIIEYEEQTKQDEIRSIYKKCVHRSGIPTQLLVNHAIPKINIELGNLLEDVPFSVWLDATDLKLKLAYNNRMDAVIDAISSSGKERTFSAIALKFALNKINAKSKPTMFLLDEVSGKLIEDSVEEFVLILQAIKENMKIVMVIEHTAEINPDYLINVTKDDNDISSLIIS